MAEYLIKFDEEIKSCDVCPFCETNDDLDSEDYRHMYCGYPHIGEFVTDYIACRHPDCPLVEMPPHGRLGDLDALAEHIKNVYCKNCKRSRVMCKSCEYGDMIDEIEDAPTIIEASTDGTEERE